MKPIVIFQQIIFSIILAAIVALASVSVRNLLAPADSKTDYASDIVANIIVIVGIPLVVWAINRFAFILPVFPRTRLLDKNRVHEAENFNEVGEIADLVSFEVEQRLRPLLTTKKRGEPVFAATRKRGHGGGGGGGDSKKN